MVQHARLTSPREYLCTITGIPIPVRFGPKNLVGEVLGIPLGMKKGTPAKKPGREKRPSFSTLVRRQVIAFDVSRRTFLLHSPRASPAAA
jgi:hypothetical protein